MSDYDFEKAAKKILGNTGKMPTPRTDPRTVLRAANKNTEELAKTLHTLSDRVLLLQNGLDAYKNSLNQYSDIVDGFKFGLDDKKPEDKKRIEQVKGIMEKGLAAKAKEADEYFGELAKLDKIITNLGRLNKMDV